METRYAVSKKEYSRMNTEELRENFLVQNMFVEGQLNLTYSHVDRIIAGGAVPTDKDIKMVGEDELAAEYFLQRREMGIISIGGDGEVIADGITYRMNRNDGLYLGRGTRDIVFHSKDAKNPANFYINSTPAHRTCPTVHIPLEKAIKVHLGSSAECNERTINKYIVPDIVESCQLAMGLTMMQEGSIWNTMPCHTHERRMEVYLYFDIDENNIVFHMMGNQTETRHIVVKNKEAVISPSWSIHSGAGTKNYTFIWGMCGENQAFDDMQFIKTTELL